MYPGQLEKHAVTVANLQKKEAKWIPQHHHNVVFDWQTLNHMQHDNMQLYKLINWPVFVQLQACTAALGHLARVLHPVSRLVFRHVWLKTVERAEVLQTHREVLAIEFELLPHVDELVEVGVVKQQVNRHVPLPAGHQDVTQQLHIAEAFHHYGQGLHRQVSDERFLPAAISHVHGNMVNSNHTARVGLLEK